jgi:hypothetical protein
LDSDDPYLFQVATDDIEDLGGVSYDYVHTSDRLALDRVALKINIGGNSRLAEFEEPIDTRIDAHSMRGSRCPVQYVYRKLDVSEDWQELELDGLDPETPYCFRIYFYSGDPKPSLIGQARTPFYGATGGVTRLANARAAIAMRALGEVDDWRRGWTRGKPYLVGRWCERFYSWNIDEHVYTAYRNGYDPRTFSRHGALMSGSEWREVAEKQNIMGDHIRIQGHGFMVLSYDEDLGQAWTIEGNFGNTVALTNRRIQNYWSVGTLVEGMLREEDPPSPAQEVAATEEPEPRDG